MFHRRTKLPKSFYKINELQDRHGDLHEVIPALAADMTLREVAAQLGVSQATVSRWLSDNGYVRVSRWVQLEGVSHG